MIASKSLHLNVLFLLYLPTSILTSSYVRTADGRYLSQMSWSNHEYAPHPVDLNQAIQVGDDDSADPIYVARALVEGNLLPGEFHAKFGTTVVNFAGKEYYVKSYQLLQSSASDIKLVWRRGPDIPGGAIVGGHLDTDNSVLYIGTAKHQGITVIGHVHENSPLMWYSWNEKAYKTADFDVLCVG